MKRVTKIEQNNANALMPKLRVAAYCRVSTDSDEQATSYEAQIEHYAAYIQKNPEWELAGIFADDGLSGILDGRDGFSKSAYGLGLLLFSAIIITFFLIFLSNYLTLWTFNNIINRTAFLHMLLLPFFGIVHMRCSAYGVVLKQNFLMKGMNYMRKNNGFSLWDIIFTIHNLSNCKLFLLLGNRYRMA